MEYSKHMVEEVSKNLKNGDITPSTQSYCGAKFMKVAAQGF
jgi:hypothetical protein